MYYPCSENKGPDQLHSYCEADLRICFLICKTLGFLMTRLIIYFFSIQSCGYYGTVFVLYNTERGVILT